MIGPALPEHLQRASPPMATWPLSFAAFAFALLFMPGRASPLQHNVNDVPLSYVAPRPRHATFSHFQDLTHIFPLLQTPSFQTLPLPILLVLLLNFQLHLS